MESSLSSADAPDDGKEGKKATRKGSWKEKLAPFMPQQRRKTQKVKLEMQNPIDDELLVVVKQVVRAILENKNEKVTKGSLYKVLIKFARCQVDLKTLKQQLHKANQELERTKKAAKNRELATVPEMTAVGEPAAKDNDNNRKETYYTASQIVKLQQMVVDLENIHKQQRTKYEEAIAYVQDTCKATQDKLDSVTKQNDELASEVIQLQGTTTACEEVIKALQEALNEKEARIKQQQDKCDDLERQLESTKQLGQEKDSKIAELEKELAVAVDSPFIEEKKVEESCSTRLLTVSKDTQATSEGEDHHVLTANISAPSNRTQDDSYHEDECCALTQTDIDTNSQCSNYSDDIEHTLRVDELKQQRREKEDNVRNLIIGVTDRASSEREVLEEHKPERLEELRKRRNSREEDVKNQMSRLEIASRVMSQQSSPPNGERQDIVSDIVVDLSPSKVKESDDLLPPTQRSLRRDASSTLNDSSYLVDNDAKTICVDHTSNGQLEELQKTLRHTEGKVVKLKHELAMTNRTLANAERKVKLLETFIMEDLNDSVVVGEVTESQRRKGALDFLEESTRSILSESQFLVKERENMKVELSELKSQLRIAQAMVSQLEKDRKVLRARIAQVEALHETQDRSDIEVKLYDLSLELADMSVERDVLKDELQIKQQQLERLQGEKGRTRNCTSESSNGASEGRPAAKQNTSLRSFLTAAETSLLTVSPPSSPSGKESFRGGLMSLLGAKSETFDESPSDEVKRLQQRIADLEMQNVAYATSVETLKQQLSERNGSVAS